jgi:hypothetical protein
MLNPQPRATAKPDQDRLDESVSEALREASVKAELVRSLDAGHCTLIPPALHPGGGRWTGSKPRLRL